MATFDTAPAQELLHIRRENLRHFIRNNGGPTAVALRLGHTNGSYLAQLAGPHPSRDVTERVARKFEGKLGLPFGYFDYDPALLIAEPAWRQRQLITAAARYVAEAVREPGLELLPPDRVAEVVTTAVTCALREGRASRELARRLVRGGRPRSHPRA